MAVPVPIMVATDSTSESKRRKVVSPNSTPTASAIPAAVTEIGMVAATTAPSARISTSAAIGRPMPSARVRSAVSIRTRSPSIGE